MNITLKSKIILIFSFILLSLNFFGDNKSDSLLKVISTNVNDTLVSEAYLNIAIINTSNNPRQALIYINKSIFYHQKISSDFQYKLILQKVFIYEKLGEYDSCIFYNSKVYSNALKLNKYQYLSDCFDIFGVVGIAQGKFQLAIEYFYKQLSVVKMHKLNVPLSKIYNNIGNAYGNKGDWQMAKEYFGKALKDDLKNNRELSLGNIYNNIGIIFIMENKMDSAKNYLNKSLAYRYKTNDSAGISGSLNNLGMLESELGNYKQALILADSALKIASANGYKRLQVEIYDSYDLIYSKMGNYKMAYNYLSKKNKLKLAFEKEQFENNIQQLESNIQLEQKQSLILEKDLALTKSENQKQRQFGFIILAVILIIALGLFLFSFF